MSDNPRLPKECEAIQPDLSEFALAILTGQRRSVVLDHVESCQRCSLELQQLSMAADAVLHLTPEIEPSLGFEQRLAERLQGGVVTMARPRHFRRIGLQCAAAVLVIVLGFGLGAMVTSHTTTGSSEAAHLTSAPLIAGGQPLGEVYISSGKPSWLFMTVDKDKWLGKVTCKLIMANGHVVTIGTYKVGGGYGAWDARFTGTSPVRSAELVGANGIVMATATLPV